MEKEDIDEVAFSGMMVYAHLFYMFINNHNGQKVIDESVDIFYRM